ncbi:MAG: type II toxin-antitoxin system VapC family toxin [Pseudomonadota bacterium]|nr:type II toxin-antitoxin system VapC family toxin [Pseudomonadota bacterium]
MRILLDTCVLSELRREQCNPDVYRSVEKATDEELFVSVITIGEIAKGACLLDDGRRKRELLEWLQTVKQDYSDRILQIDLETVEIWGELTARAQKSGKTVAASDGLIAATALRHGLHVMTGNVDDFLPTGVLLSNPWAE